MKEHWPGELGGIAQEGPPLCGCVSLGRSVGYSHGSSVPKDLLAVTVLSSHAGPKEPAAQDREGIWPQSLDGRDEK